jgi:hypothetical protein
LIVEVYIIDIAHRSFPFWKDTAECVHSRLIIRKHYPVCLQVPHGIRPKIHGKPSSNSSLGEDNSIIHRENSYGYIHQEKEGIYPRPKQLRKTCKHTNDRKTRHTALILIQRSRRQFFLQTHRRQHRVLATMPLPRPISFYFSSWIIRRARQQHQL